MTRRDRVTGGMLGLVVGDALGVPAEGRPREWLRRNPITAIRGAGSGRAPPGTWSDDSSMALQTAASLLEHGYDPEDMMERFRRWLFRGEMTPHSEAWGFGQTTLESILRYRMAERMDPDELGIPREPYGGQDESDNGNGSLMRILPLGLWLADRDDVEVIDKAGEASALTHAHVRSRLCCAYHCLVVKAIMAGGELPKAIARATEALDPHVPDGERAVLEPILSGAILAADEATVESSGYVVHTLGASLWCCARHGDYRGAVLEAVNLGGDTDTTGAVAGGLAGVLHGIDAIPAEWIDALEAAGKVRDVVERFADRVGGEEAA